MVSVDGETIGVDGESFRAYLLALEGAPVRLVTIGNEVHRVVVRRGETRGRYTLWIDGWRYEVEAVDERTHTIRAMTAVSAPPAGPAPIRAPMPGLVVRVAVEPGDEVAAGQGVVVVEAMKMENELRASVAGRVRAVHATAGQAVEKGAILVELE
jgi:pyruvate carboxylase subunit B